MKKKNIFLIVLSIVFLFINFGIYNNLTVNQYKPDIQKSEKYLNQEIINIDSKTVNTTKELEKSIKSNDIAINQQKESEIKETLTETDLIYSYLEKNIKTGTLEIPVLSLKMPIFKGLNTKEDNMMYGAVEQLKGQEMRLNNYILASHKVNNPNILFGNIHNLKNGDLINLKDNQYQYTYTVYNNFTVTDKDLWILQNFKLENQENNANSLTLYTCNYATATVERTVVRAILTKIKPLGA